MLDNSHDLGMSVKVHPQTGTEGERERMDGQPRRQIVKVMTVTRPRNRNIVKVALALLNASKRLCPYFQSHQVVVRTDHPISKILRKPDLAGRMVGWAIKLSEFGLRYEPRGSVRGQHLINFAIELPHIITSDEWNLYVDGASGRMSGVVGVVLEGPNGFLLEHSLVFKFKASNNQTKYEALVAGLELAQDMGVHSLTCRTHSQLVVKDHHLLRYFHKASALAKNFHKIEIKHISREDNPWADMLSKLNKGKERGQLTTIIRQVLLQPSVECLPTTTTEIDDWRTIRPVDAKKIVRYVFIGGHLYRRGFFTPLLKCLFGPESQYVLDELHNGICGLHTRHRTLKGRVITVGYFWPTMEEDARLLVQSIISPWSFAQWGMDIVAPFPPRQAQKKFLLVAIDYFTRWVEAKALATIITQQVQKFVWKLVFRFGLPRTMVTENRRQFINKKLGKFYRGLGIKHVTSLVEHPQTNGQAEAVNKAIAAELKKRWMNSPRFYGHIGVLHREQLEELKIELETLEERRDRVFRAKTCKRMVEIRYNTKVQPRSFQEGDMVWRKTGEASTKWEGPFKIVEALGNGVNHCQLSRAVNDELTLSSSSPCYSSLFWYNRLDRFCTRPEMVNSQDWLYNLIKRLPKYHGVAGEDPHMHLKEFQVVCLMFKPEKVPEDWAKLKTFPFSLGDATKDWFYYKDDTSPFTSWADMQRSFLEKFFPTSTTISKRREISSIMQLQGETFREYWDRFNQLCASCPDHQISEHLLILHFLDGLSMQDRFYVDAAAGGSMMDKTISEARTLLAKLSGCPNEASESAVSTGSELQPVQVYSELSIPINLPEFQMDFNAFDLFKVEPIEPVLDPIPVMHSHSLDSAFDIEHVDISIVASDLWTDFDTVSIDDSLSTCGDATSEFVYTGEVVFDEPVQVDFDFNPTTSLFEIRFAFNILHALPVIPADSIHSKLLEDIFVVNQLNAPAYECSDFNEVISDDLFDNMLGDFDFNLDKVALFDDSPMYSEFGLAVDTLVADTNFKGNAETKEILVKAGDGVRAAQGTWKTQNQQQLHKEPWLLQQGAWKVQMQLSTFDGELMMLRQRPHGETPKTMRPFCSFFLNSSYRSLIEISLIIGDERQVQPLNHCRPVNKFSVDQRRIPLGNHYQLGRAENATRILSNTYNIFIRAEGAETAFIQSISMAR
ncbi:hypothetical protein V8G54_017733 [Vigna mungo]|uniref:Integrase catalytic domain-containing protein n=1 Tax=Vigna mungo TaxID=3915 RepID=A0AAQ3S1M3_VIGMU